ncbi:hypothetical protein FHS79_002285 [Polymorphobacter multimanifer]|uniref:Uncharacterized protein n=1 Tax=Polymorphobacter multimanifer TaxID=1070431 RepID=A0A841L6Q4_9SPHN|nr:hypothetical protein [Polymorphobacter multimanifer]
MHEHLFAALLVVFGKGTVDGAVGKREGAAIGMGVVDDVMEHPALGFGKAEAGHRFGCGVHEDAPLVVVHHEQRHAGVVDDGIEPVGGPAKLLLGAPGRGHILDRGEEYGIFIGPQQLQPDLDVVVRAILSRVHGLECQYWQFAADKRHDHFPKLLLGYQGLDLPRSDERHFGGLIAEIHACLPVDEDEPEGACVEDIGLAKPILDDPRPPIASKHVQPLFRSVRRSNRRRA